MWARARRQQRRVRDCHVPLVAMLLSVLAMASSEIQAQGAARYDQSGVDAYTLLRLAEQGDTRAAFLLGSRFAAGGSGPRDDSEAARWFRQAAEGGLGEAQYNLGIMYAAGRGVPRNPAEAAHWFRLAGEQGLAQAQHNLGVMYGTGEGVPRDPALALAWLSRAAAAGLAPAQFNLGVLHEHGRGTPRDVEAAIEWYARAAEQGYEPARERLGSLRARLASKPSPTATVAGTAGDPRGWVETLDPKHYTIQVFSDTDEADVRRFVRRHLEPGLGGYFASDRQGKRWYSVVYGAYPTYAAARAAAAVLPAELRQGRPWVRKVHSIMEAMRP
jgi:TPR repeat protein